MRASIVPLVFSGAAMLACAGGTPGVTAPAGSEGAPAATPDAVTTATGDAVARIRARGVLLVGVDTGEPPGEGTPPMYFVDAAGKADGFDDRVARWVATSIGVPEVRFVHQKYADLPTALVESQQFDVVISGYTPSPEPGVAWSDGYLDFGLCLIVPATSKVATTQDLWGKAIGIFDDDAAATEVQAMVKGYTDLIRMEDGYFDALHAGRFAGFIYDYPYAVAELDQWYAANPGKAGAFRIAQYNLTDNHYAVGVRTADADLLAAVNEGISRFRASDDYARSVQTYLSGGSKVAAPKTAAKVYVVRQGDTLSRIAARELGGPDAWRQLWGLNKDRFPNPHLIEVGDEVILPG